MLRGGSSRTGRCRLGKGGGDIGQVYLGRLLGGWKRVGEGLGCSQASSCKSRFVSSKEVTG